MNRTLCCASKKLRADLPGDILAMSGPPEALSYTSPSWFVEIIVLFSFCSDMAGWKASRFYQNEARKAEGRHLWIL